jgi:hypothetical protein
MDQVVRLTEAHLLRTARSFAAAVRADRSYCTFLLSVAILRHFLGAEWSDRHLTPNGQPGFLRQDQAEKTRSESQAWLVTDLADCLFNLQHIVGFDECITKMRDGDLEATYAELDFGRMLYSNHINFRFVRAMGKKGADYDVEIIMDDGAVVCGDAKCKIETTEFSADTVLNSLKKARSQFPKDRPSVIFVKVPKQWGLTDGIAERLIDVAFQFMRGTARIVSVKYYCSMIEWRGGEIMHVQAFHEISNPNNRFDPNKDWSMFEGGETDLAPDGRGEFSTFPQRWHRLLNLWEKI